MKPGPRYGWIVLCAVIAVNLGALGLGRFGYTVILPSMRAGLGLDDARAGALSTANAIGYLIGSLLVGLTGSRGSRRNRISLSLLGVAAAMSLTGLARAFAAALALRFATGFLSAGANVAAAGLLPLWFAERKRGLATGLAVGGSSVGLLLTGTILPRIVSAPEGWRWGWQALAIAAALLSCIAWIFLRDHPRELGLEPVGTEGAGRATLAAAPAAEPRANAVEQRAIAPEAAAAFAAEPAAEPAAGGGAVRAVLRNADARLLCLIYPCYGFSYIIFSTFYARYLVAEIGFSPEGAGALWAGIGAVSFLGGLAWGAFSDRFGRKTAFLLSFAILSGCFLTFGLWKAAPGAVVSSIAFALTAWSVVAVMTAAVGDAMGERGPASFGIVTFCFGIGQAAGPYAAGAIADATGSFSIAFAAAGAAAAAGGVLSLLLGPRLSSPASRRGGPSPR